MKYDFDLSSQWSRRLSGQGQPERWFGVSVEGGLFVSSHTIKVANNSSQECLFLFATLYTDIIHSHQNMSRKMSPYEQSLPILTRQKDSQFTL